MARFSKTDSVVDCPFVYMRNLVEEVLLPLSSCVNGEDRILSENLIGTINRPEMSIQKRE